MFPWEHAAVAYLWYAGYARWHGDAPPAGWGILVVLFASQFPDLIDKPLAWQLSLLASGRSLAHSVFVAVPLAYVGIAVARRADRMPLGVVGAIGFLSHLATDAVPLSPSEDLNSAVVLWPLVTSDSSSSAAGSSTAGAVGRASETLLDAYPSLSAGEPTLEAGIRLGIVGLAGVVWLADGRPGVYEGWRVVRWSVATIQSWARRVL